MQAQSTLAEWLKNVGLTLLVVALLARLGIGLYLVGTDPSLSLLSWEGLKAMLVAYRTDAVPSSVRTAILGGGALGVVLWLMGWLVGLRRSLS
jgi:hypothetical protein